jgi:NTE family protein
VLSAFQEMKIPISYLSGSSSGSFVGALYAGGIEGPALEACGRDYRWRDAGRIRYIPKMGLATNERMASYLEERIGRPVFEKLRLPLYIVAADLAAGRPRVFNEGPVIPAVRASCAIPGIFEPVEMGGRLYCDGGVLNPLPCGVLRGAGADLVIAVELWTSVEKQPDDIFEVINRAFTIARLRTVEEERRAADLIIRPNVDDLHAFGFDQNEMLIERGRRAALDLLRQWPNVQAASAESRTEPVG